MTKQEKFKQWDVNHESVMELIRNSFKKEMRYAQESLINSMNNTNIVESQPYQPIDPDYEEWLKQKFPKTK